MPRIGSVLLVVFLLQAAPQNGQVMAGLLTSDVIDYVRAIVRDNGYNVSETDVYQIYINQTKDTLVRGYTTIHVLEHDHPIFLIMLSNTTGQTIEFNACQVFNYPDIRRWRDRVLRQRHAVPKTPQELAREVGCSNPKVLSEPVPLRRQQ